jgi:hypothetical protein
MHCTENSKHIPSNETAGPCFQFLDSCTVSVSDLHIPMIGPQSWEFTNCSQIHECGNWETEHYKSVLEITWQRPFHFWEYINRNQTFIGFSPVLHLQCMNYLKIPKINYRSFTCT